MVLSRDTEKDQRKKQASLKVYFILLPLESRTRFSDGFFSPCIGRRSQTRTVLKLQLCVELSP